MEDTRPWVQGQRQITCHGKRCSKSRILCPSPELQLLQAKEVEEREREDFFFFFKLECKQLSSRELTILECLQRRQQVHFISLRFQDWLLFRQAWIDSPRNVGTSWRIASYYQVIICYSQPSPKCVYDDSLCTVACPRTCIILPRVWLSWELNQLAMATIYQTLVGAPHHAGALQTSCPFHATTQ